MNSKKIKDINVCLRLGEERKRLHLNQNKVAEHCEVSVKSVGRWEKNIPIPADKLALLVELGYDITYILTGVKLASQVAGLDAALLAVRVDVSAAVIVAGKEDPVPGGEL